MTQGKGGPSPSSTRGHFELDTPPPCRYNKDRTRIQPVAEQTTPRGHTVGTQTEGVMHGVRSVGEKRPYY